MTDYNKEITEIWDAIKNVAERLNELESKVEMISNSVKRNSRVTNRMVPLK